jgi:hypothetical protein
MDDKMSNKQKIRIDIIPEDNVDINELRSNVHSLINLNREGCRSIRSWIETLKTCESVHQSTSELLVDNHRCILTEGHKEKHRCECGFSWDII